MNNFGNFENFKKSQLLVSGRSAREPSSMFFNDNRRDSPLKIRDTSFCGGIAARSTPNLNGFNLNLKELTSVGTMKDLNKDKKIMKS